MKRLGDAGFSLLESLIASVLLGMATVIVFSVISMAPKGMVSLHHNDQALQAAAGLSEVLKNYVTGDGSAQTVSYAPDGAWTIAATDICGHALALNCVHQVPAGWLSQELRDRGGSLSYTVDSISPPGGGDPVLNVSVSVQWTEPP